jgi:hypothetical protein
VQGAEIIASIHLALPDYHHRTHTRILTRECIFTYRESISRCHMLTSSALYHLWKRQVFLRNRHDELTSLLGCSWLNTGIYMIGCADRVVYIGQSNQLSQRSIDSLGRVYHRVQDTSLSWSMAFAPCAHEDMDEYESAAIRAYAPEFNTSIPSTEKSLGRMPVIAGSAQVFAGQSTPSTAFFSSIH